VTIVCVLCHSAHATLTINQFVTPVSTDTKKLGYATPNLTFKRGFIEFLADAG
jgi:hypothetical protein